jgi:putative membrane protein
MNHLKSSLSTLPALALVLGLAACGGSNQSQATTPTASNAGYTEAPAPASSQYGATLGQAGSRSTESGTSAGTNVPTPQPYPGSSPSTGTGTTGAPDTMGPTGTTGTTGSMGTTGTTSTPSGPSTETGQYGTQGQSQYGAPSTMGSPGAAAMGGPIDLSGLNDGQLAAVVLAVHEGEIEAAQLAEQKAMSADVKKFARSMITAHRDMMNKDNALCSRMQITPTDNAVSNQVRTDAQNELSTLQSMRGKDFDRDYIDGQIRDHNRALELIDRMLPNVKSPDFKSALQTSRAKVEAHLRMAERVQQTLMKGATNKQPSSNKPGQSPATPRPDQMNPQQQP